MIVLTNNAEQTVAAGASMTFDNAILHTGNGECYRQGTGSVKLRYAGIYEVHFGANISGATAATAVQLSIQLGGDTLPETTAISVPTAANDFNDISITTAVKNCCGDYDRITVTNTGTESVIIAANPVLYIKRIA